jgi:hypothetical protein
MDSRYQEPIIIRDAEIPQPCLEFSDAGVAVCDAGKPLRFSHALVQEPRDFYRDRLRLPCTGPSEDNAVSFRFEGAPLARIIP